MQDLGFPLYYNPRSEVQCENIAMFNRIRARFPWMGFSLPSADKAPWHVQCVVRYGASEGGIVLNFWPHKGKAQREDFKPVSGEENIRSMIAEAIDDSQEGYVELFE